MSELTDVSNQLSSQNRSLRETFTDLKNTKKKFRRIVTDEFGNKLSEIYTHGFENQGQGRCLGSSGLSGVIIKSLGLLKSSMESIKEENNV